jgi:8-oxo-dGTP diphosphatase
MRAAVIGIVFNNERTGVLILKRNDVPVWVLPGGGIDPKESPEKAVIREMFEETGLVVKIERQVGEYTPINRLAHQTYVFECQTIEGQLTTGPETREIGFHKITNLPSTFFFIHSDWLQDALKNSPEVIKSPLVRITYFELFKYFLKHPILVTRVILSRLGYPINSK